MNIQPINPMVQLLQEPKSKEELYKRIEICGRICYKSEDLITEDSTERFIRSIIKRGHETVLESGNIILQLEYNMSNIQLFNTFKTSPYLNLSYHFTFNGVVGYVSGNVRAWRDRFKLGHATNIDKACYTYLRLLYSLLFEDIKIEPIIGETSINMKIVYIDDLVDSDAKKIHGRATAHWICSRSCSHQLVRHRAFSFLQESQRYCNYNKSGNLIAITPYWINSPLIYSQWLNMMDKAYDNYKELINLGCKPEEARGVLPNDCKTELMVSFNFKHLDNFFNLRTDAHAQPEIRRLALELQRQVIEEYYFDIKKEENV